MTDYYSLFKNNRPRLRDIPSLFRLLAVSKKAHSYLQYSNPEMIKAGLNPSSREGIWMFIAEESLKSTGYRISNSDKSILLELFTVLRRIYKSADDAWDQNRKIRDFIIKDPLSRITEPLRWTDKGIKRETNLSSIFNYLYFRLDNIYSSDQIKKDSIFEIFASFIKKAAWTLVDFEELNRIKRPDLSDYFDMYDHTTGEIGLTIANLVNTVSRSDNKTKKNLSKIFQKASLLSQLVDDIIDSPLDILDDQSPSFIKSLLSKHNNEYESVKKCGNLQISYRQFSQLAPKTAYSLEKNYLKEFLRGIPPKIQQFLRDFFLALPPATVSHKDPKNKNLHTELRTNQMIKKYLHNHKIKNPFKMVDFIKLSGAGIHKCHLGMLIDPDKQTANITGNRVMEFIENGGNVILIGGSGKIKQSVFNSTVQTVTNTVKLCKGKAVILIFPGHLDQIPLSPAKGLKGVLNYSDILGNPNSKGLTRIYPESARIQVNKLIKERDLQSISTLYVLCGDPNASVTKISGILPLDPDNADHKNFLFRKVKTNLRNGVSCIYLEGGSGSSKPISADTVSIIRSLIKTSSPQTLLFVGGGIKDPEHIKLFAPLADCIVIGTYFENEKVDIVKKFVALL